MNVVEISHSLHGEAPLAGKPCMIIRFQACNLECDYCDAVLDAVPTHYTPQGLFELVTTYNPASILLTGGEPLLEPELGEFIQLLEHYLVVVETNGTMDIYPLLGAHVQIAMDFKLDLTSELEVLTRRNVGLLCDLDVVKFVFRGYDDWLKAWAYIEQLEELHVWQCAIIFSPTKPDEAGSYVDDFIKRCKDYPRLDIRLQIQQHKVLGVA